MKKIVYVVLDNLAGAAVKQFGDRTSLEAALTPHMDKFTQRGASGIVYILGKDIAAESDVGLVSLLGYDVYRDYSGRGVLEAVSQGLVMEDGHVAVRVNFAAVEDNSRIIKDRRAGGDLTPSQAAALAEELNTEVILSDATFEFKNTGGHRGVLVIRAMHSQLSAQITNTDPAYEKRGTLSVEKIKFRPCVLKAKPSAGYENSILAQQAAHLLNEFTRKSHNVLSESLVNRRRLAGGKLAANMVLCRDAGDHLPSFVPLDGRFGIKFGFFTGSAVEKGICFLSGACEIDGAPFTGYSNADYAALAKMIGVKLKNYDGLYVPLRPFKKIGTKRIDFKEKLARIEALDKYFFGSLLSLLDKEDVVIAVTSAHAPVCAYEAGFSGGMPLMISGGAVKPDGTFSFSERAAKEGSLGVLSGQDVMGLLVKLAKQ